LPDALRGTATAEALQAIVDVDLDTLAVIEPPRSYRRDWRHAVVRPVRTAAWWCWVRTTASRAALRAPASRLRPLTPSPSPGVWQWCRFVAGVSPGNEASCPLGARW